jgi:murein DD-endopeptidase MepM/ murein hydrolase activator NlpD
MDLNKFLEDIKKELFKDFQQKPVNLDTGEQVFQNPIKSEYKNIGDFGVTNPTHPTGHKGIDIAAEKGTPVYPLTDGVVTKIYNDPKGGLAINIKHDNNYRSYYAHLNSVNVKVNDKVNLNTQIGTVGNSGNASGTSPHVHFQVWKNNQIINPATLFEFKKYNT